MAEDLPICGDLVLPGASLRWRAVRSSGPGGQNVNKVSTCVELRFDPAACPALGHAVRARLLRLAGRRLDAEGRIFLVCQQGRSQSANLELARQRLAALVMAALATPRRRRKTRPSRGAVERRLQAKRRRARTKADRARPPPE